MLTSCRSALFVSVVTWCVACGGKSNADERDGGGGSSSGGSAGGKPAGGSSSGGSGAGGRDTDPACKAWIDDDSHYVPVSIINDSSETLFVGQEQVTCDEAPPFEVTDEDGRVLAAPGACRSSCESAMTSGPSACPAVCLLPSAVELAPGDELLTEWRGRYLEQVLLPERCQSPEFATPVCDRAVAVEPGPYVFSAKAGTKLDCEPAGGVCMPCQPDVDGVCVTGGALISGAIRRAETQVELDASYGIGSGNGDGAIQFVFIRFQGP